MEVIIVLKQLLKVCLKDISQSPSVNRLIAVLGIYHDGVPFRISGSLGVLMSLKNNGKRISEEESVALVLDKLSLSENNAVVSGSWIRDTHSKKGRLQEDESWTKDTFWCWSCEVEKDGSAFRTAEVSQIGFHPCKLANHVLSRPYRPFKNSDMWPSATHPFVRIICDQSVIHPVTHIWSIYNASNDLYVSYLLPAFIMEILCNLKKIFGCFKRISRRY